MKLEPKNYPEDEYDDDTYRFWEKLDENGYYYEIYVFLDGKESRIVITEDGVSIDFRESGECIATNITPKYLFPNAKELNWDNQLEKILETLKAINFEGRTYSKEEMDTYYKKFLKETEPNDN